MNIISETIQAWSDAGIGNLFVLSFVIFIVVFIVCHVMPGKSEPKLRILGLFGVVVIAIFACAFISLGFSILLAHVLF